MKYGKRCRLQKIGRESPLRELWEYVNAAPLLWLSDCVKAIPVYNAGYLDAPMNDSQRYALSLLVNRKMVNDQKLYI